ncbi:chromosome segregation protein SMC [Nanoarchaeota archaeon]
MTKINKLVMHGFKSFAKRTELVFGNQFNCVLGPNGSGKSNILDALCFVLGKSSAKALRSEKSANLIYNGGKSKKPAKEGEVSIYFDNASKVFPSDDKEIKISRIVRATGQSVYKINNKTKTRQEMLELMSLAKINPDGYNIILQGDIVSFVEMPTVERRQLVEEIAGIRIYEEKKQKALNELNRVEERLKEADIVLTERKSSLNQLKKERDQASKYKDLNDKITTNRATVIHRKIKAKTTQKEEYDKKIAEQQEKLDAKNKELQEFKQNVSEIKENIDKINQEIEQKGEKDQVDMHKEVEKLKVDLGTGKNRIESLNNEIERINTRKKQLSINLKELEEKISKIDTEKKEYDDQIKARNNQKQEIQQRIADFRKKNNLDNIGDIEKDVDKLDKEAEDKQREIQELRKNQQDILREKDRIEFQIQSADEKISKVLEVEKENKVQVEELKAKKKQFKESTLELNKMVNDDAAYSGQLSNARSKLLNANEQLSKLRAKNTSIQEHLSGDIALKKILENKKNLGGVYGTVSELGQVSSEFALALEISAGAKIKSIVVESDATASKCIKFLKENKLGVATFLPLNKIKSVTKRPELKKYENANGVKGFAIDLISFDSKFKDVFSYVFGNTLVVDDINTARRIGIGNAKMTTLEGDLTKTSGAMQGGFRQRKKGMGFQQKELIRDIDRYEHDASDTATIIQALEEKKQKGEERITNIRQLKANLEADIIKLEKILHLDSDDMDATKKLKEDLKKQSKEFDKTIDSVNMKVSELNKVLAQNKISRQGLRTKITELRNPRLLAELNTFEEKLSQLKEEIMAKEGNVKNLDAQITNILQPEKENINKILKQHNKEEQDFKSEIKKSEDEMKNMETSLKEKEKAQQKFHEQFKGLFGKRGSLDEKLKKLDTKIDTTNDDIKKYEQKITAFSLENAKYKAELAAFDQEFEQYKEAKIDEKKSDEELKREISQFERMVANIGSVNMKALEIYDSAEKEYYGLVEKKERLGKEREDVLMMINEIEAKKTELFMKTLEVVNGHFQSTFAQLSTKGECSLVLENPQQPFEGGLMIKVKLTGTKFMDIRSLSGGEKTLTALAFIFAIQEHDPASFYVLDEVDAALDKKNSELLAKLVRKYTDKAQYVVISHNDGVIAEADILYGVSMNEHGSSNVVSLKI